MDATTTKKTTSVVVRWKDQESPSTFDSRYELADISMTSAKTSETPTRHKVIGRLWRCAQPRQLAEPHKRFHSQSC